jgi:hypothetical protein
MERSKTQLKKGNYIGNQQLIIRFRASDTLYRRLKTLSLEEELCLSAFVRKLVNSALEKFPT